MEFETRVRSLSALAHPGRLALFRRLVRAGSPGLAAGQLAKDLSVHANTLSAQLSILSAAQLINSRRDGRSIIYKANLANLNALVLFLIEDCCDGRDEVCTPILEALQAADC